MSNGLLYKVAVFAICVCTCIFAFGQAEMGTIAGVVKDTTGAVVADAQVVVKNLATNAERTTTSGNLGQYDVPALPPGNYQVSVSKAGFKTYQTKIEVAVGGHSTVDADLSIGSGNTVVEVTAGGAATEVNTQTQELSQLINNQQLAQLPSLNRNPYDFVAISGNVSNGDVGIGEQRPCNVEVVIGQLWRSAARAPHKLRRLQARARSLPNEGALELRQRTEHVKDQDALRRGGVD